MLYSCVFAYNKNYQELALFGGKQVRPSSSASKNINAIVESEQKYKVFTLDFVLKRLLDYGEEKGEARC